MNKLFLWIAAASAFVLQSCENTDGIRDEIGSLRDRVIALEAKIGSVNTSIVALHKLMDESTIIVGIEPNAKGYEIELSDGTRLPVILGEKIEALVPVMGIDAEGYWTVRPRRRSHFRAAEGRRRVRFGMARFGRRP